MASTKIYTLFAGVNGAGKSTLFSAHTAADLGVRLNTDEIVKERGWDWRDASAQLRAGRELLRRQKECLEKGISFNQADALPQRPALRAKPHIFMVLSLMFAVRGKLRREERDDLPPGGPALFQPRK